MASQTLSDAFASHFGLPRWLPRRYFTHLLYIVASQMDSLRGHTGGFPDAISRMCSTFRHAKWLHEEVTQVASQTLFDAFAPHCSQRICSICWSPRWPPRRYFTHLLHIVASQSALIKRSHGWLPRRYFTHLLPVLVSQMAFHTLFHAFAPDFGFPEILKDAISRICGPPTACT